MTNPREATVVLVHGLWMRGFEFMVFRRLLQRHYRAHVKAFSYRSVASGAWAQARELRFFCHALSTPMVHLVGHSLGGLVVLKALEDNENPDSGPAIAPGRVVLLGAPVQGSLVGRRLAALPLFRRAMGAHMRSISAVGEPRAYAGREVGVIAGSVPGGAGRLIARLPLPNDGSVAVDETRLVGAIEHLVLPVTHTTMVFSRAVARATGQFLQDGSFGLSSRGGQSH